MTNTISDNYTDPLIIPRNKGFCRFRWRLHEGIVFNNNLFFCKRLSNILFCCQLVTIFELKQFTWDQQIGEKTYG